MLLAIDTSVGTSVAIVDRDAGVIAEHSSADTRRHAEMIGALISACLTGSGVAAGAVSAVAVGMGPGPFTGLRVGIAAADSFALGIGRPVVRVVSHDAIAFAAYSRGLSGPLLVVTDARRREVYWTSYRGTDAAALPARTAGPALARPDAMPSFDGIRVDATEVSAGALGLLAESMFLHGREFAGSAPLYLRKPDVTVSTERKRVGS